jgi:hypothetical protein
VLPASGRYGEDLTCVRSQQSAYNVEVSSFAVIDPRFKLNQIVDVRLTVRNPVHAADNATQGKSSLGIAARHLLERLQHAILIEPTVLKVGFSAAPKFELAASLD